MTTREVISPLVILRPQPKELVQQADVRADQTVIAGNQILHAVQDDNN
jgi:ABC-type uncharacterized transport system involved in gliding motility auxiliary subunit